MSAAPDIPCVRGSDSLEMLSVPPPFNPTAMSRLEGHPVLRVPEQLRPHRALQEFGWTGVIDEFSEAARLKSQSVPEPIFITTDGTILAGYGTWRLAIFEGKHEIPCIEYPLSADDSLRFRASSPEFLNGYGFDLPPKSVHLRIRQNS